MNIQLRKWMYIALLSICCLLLIIPEISGCAKQEGVSPPAPEPTPPLVEEWSADGVIKANEYHSSNKYDDYELYWRSDEQYLYIGMKAKTNGWVSIGIQPGSKMKDADMIFGFVEDGQVTVMDLFSTGNFGPHPPDVELGGTDDILVFGGEEEGEFTTIEFKRALSTNDNYDLPIMAGVNKIIWSFGSNDSFTQKHARRGNGEIDI